MIKRTIFLMCLIVSTLYLNAINSTAKKINSTAQVELISSNIETSIVKVSFDNFQTIDVTTSKGLAKKLSLKGAVPMLLTNAPELLTVSASIIIPDNAEMDLKVISESYTDYQNIIIAPSKGNLFRNIDPSTIAYTFGKQYGINEFFPGKLAELQNPYILRDYRGQTITFYPFQYNPVTKTLRVYKNLTVKATQIGISNFNNLSRFKSFTKIDTEFEKIYKSQFINSNSGNSKYTPVAEDGKMLIICPDQFMASMQALVQWRNISGTPTQMISVTTAGSTSAAIKSYISNYYTTNGLTYVILVGDVAQIPTFTAGGGGSDNTYGYLSGNDHYPEVFVGRISAETFVHVATQVQKILTYEINPSNGNGWLNRGTGIASSEGPGDNSEYDYQHIRNIRAKLMNYEYTNCSELYDGSQGGADAAGNPTASMVSSDVNNGVGIMYYTGHGSDNSWATTGYSNTNVSNLTNTTAWPFIFSVACVNGNFTTGTCFAETWMRAVYNEQPSGAVATLMSTINQSWNPPMYGQDAMIDILTESVQGNIKRTFGGISMNGCMKMNDQYLTQGDDMTDTWNIFGDPALMIRTDTAKNMIVSHNSVVFIGASTFAVNCNVEGAKITLSINNLPIGSAIVSNGVANIIFPLLANIDSIKVVATAYNRIPYIGVVQIIVPSGPYIQFNGKQVVDIAGNNNGLADYNENVSLNVDLKNMGVATATNVSASISTTDTNVVITNNQFNWGNISAGTNIIKNNAFSFNIKNNVEDQHLVTFNLVIVDGNSNTWNTNFNITLNAPKLFSGNIIIKDSIIGNNNGRLDPGETAQIIIPSKNVGNSNCSNVTGVLTSQNTNVSIINSNSYSFNALNVAVNNNAFFTVHVDSSTVTGTNAELNYILSSGAYQTNTTYNQIVGLVNEDFETNTFTKFNWVQGGNAPWTITSASPYEGSYSAKSGVIGNSKTSTFSVIVNVTSNDTISFIKKTSCETSAPNSPSYDYLEFMIDNTSMGRWDGETAWSKSAFAISTGVHTLKWVYKKDNYGVAGSDCVWIDYIKFPSGFVSKAPLSCTLTTLEDTICENTSIQLFTMINGGLGNNNYTWSSNPQTSQINGSNPFVSPHTTTTYNVFITDATNVSTNASITIYVYPVPMAPSISQNGNQLISSSASNNQWFDDNGMILNANSNTYSPLNTGNYYVKEVTPEGCYSDSSNVIYVGFLGTDDLLTSEFNIYPNPFSKEFNIEFQSKDNSVVSIYNSIGQLIENINIVGGNSIQKTKITASNYEKGIYFIQINTKEKSIIKKIIKIE